MTEPQTPTGKDIVRGMHPAFMFRLIGPEVVAQVEAEAIAIGARGERDFYSPLVAEAFDMGAKAERERIRAALVDLYNAPEGGPKTYLASTVEALLAEPEETP
jgi:hypothetical protein